MDDKFAALLKRLEAVTTKLETMEPAGGAPAPPPVAGATAVADERPSPMVAAFNDLVAGPVTDYVKAAGAINMAETVKQAGLVKAAFEAQRDMLVLVSKCKKPSDADFQKAALKLEAIGFAVGHRLVERYTRDRPRFSDTLEIIKFICKDFWCAPRNFAAHFRTVV